MIDIRRGIARIGYALLALWITCWILFFASSALYGHPDWSQWPFLVGTILATLIGFPLTVFLLWRGLLWIFAGFIRLS
jgi:hypothetical protein